jgi:hypothetical protein
MSKRLQVLLDEAEYEEIRAAARRERMTVAEWVRHGLRKARSEEPSRSAQEKFQVLERAADYGFPAGDIDQILDDIERGRSSGLPR